MRVVKSASHIKAGLIMAPRAHLDPGPSHEVMPNKKPEAAVHPCGPGLMIREAAVWPSVVNAPLMRMRKLVTDARHYPGHAVAATRELFARQARFVYQALDIARIGGPRACGSSLYWRVFRSPSA